VPTGSNAAHVAVTIFGGEKKKSAPTATRFDADIVAKQSSH
jgi:hypothetical protein